MKRVLIVLYFFIGMSLQAGGWNLSNNNQQQSSSDNSGGWAIGSQATPANNQQNNAGGWQFATPSDNHPTDISQGSGWKLETNSPPLDSQSGSWSLNLAQSPSGVHIYDTQTYQNIQQQLFALQLSIGNTLQEYTEEQTVSAGANVWTLTKDSNTGLQQSANQQTSSFNYTQHFTTFMQYITGSKGSYLDFTQQMFRAYSELYPMYQKKMVDAKQPVSADAQEYYKNLPFTPGAVTLELLQSAIGSILEFLTMRLQLITVNNYGEPENEQFFVGDSKNNSIATIAQLQLAVNQFESLFQSQYSAYQVTGLDGNYKTSIASYQKGQARLIITFTLTLLKYLQQKYPISLALNPAITEIDINFAVLSQLYTLCQQGVQAFSQDKNPPKFDSYDTLDAVLNGMRTSLGQLFAYAGTVGQNSIKQDVIQKGRSVDAADIQNRLEIISQLYANAASYYLNSGDTSSYNAYYTFAKNLMLGSQAWQSGQAFSQQGSYQQAADRYNFGYDILTQVGSTELAILLLQLANDANLNAAQQGLTLYAQYPEYQSSIAQYASSAQLVPSENASDQEQAFQSVFYTPNDKIHYGLAVIAGGVAPSYSTILNGLQSQNQDGISQKKLQLQNAITVLEAIEQGAQDIFISTAGLGGFVAADTNLYGNYYDPEAVFEGQRSYSTIIDTFKKADDALTALPNNPYVPLGQLFSLSSVKTFKELVQLHSARLSLLSGAYAWQFATSNDPDYAQYKQPCTVSALLSFMYARKVYAFLQNHTLVEYCHTQLKQLTGFNQTIIEDIQARIGKSDASKNDYEIALVQCWALGFLQDASASKLLRTVIDAYVAAVQNKNTWNDSFPDVTAAYALYRGYLWSLHVQDVDGAQTYKNALNGALQKVMATLTALLNTANNQQALYEDRINAQIKVKDFETVLQEVLLSQGYDQALLTLSGQNMCELVQKTLDAVPQNILTFVTLQNVAPVTFKNSLYQLAELYAANATNALGLLQQDFDAPTPDYSKETTQVFDQIVSDLQESLSSYSQLGLQDKVISAEQALTEAIAFRYLSNVIPSDQVRTTIQLKEVATITKVQPTANGSGSWALNTSSEGPVQQSSSSGGWSLSNNNQNQSAVPQNSPTINLKQTLPLSFPSYLLRFWQENLTELKTKADAVVNEYQKGAAEGQSIPPVAANKQKFYSALLTTAQGLVGKTDPDSMAKLVTDIAVPLYKEELTDGGFQGIFRTLDQEVELYKTQLAYMIGTGMQVAGKNFTSSLKLELQKDNSGNDQVVLTGSYMPLECIPRYKNDFRSALFYYGIYQKFFTPSTQPISLGNALYFPIDNENKRLRGQKEMERAYLASTIRFDEEITTLVQPLQQLTMEQKRSKNLADYKDTYEQLAKAYSWIFATYDGIDEMQNSSGVSYIDINEKRQSLYQEYGDNCALFLLGTPLDSGYQSVIRDAVDNYLFATNYVTGASVGDFKNAMYQKGAQLNVAAGDMCVQQSQALPQIADYPSAAATNVPGDVTANNPKKLSCTPLSSFTWPAGKAITWRYFQEAQGYYSEAAHLYSEGYKAIHNQSTSGIYNDATIRTVFGKEYMASVRSALQRIILFARNALDVNVSKDPSGGIKYGVFLSEKFTEIKQDGASGGAIGAIQGAGNLIGGSGGPVNQNAVAQFELMKKLILDGIIYFTPVSSSLQNIITDLGGVTNTQDEEKVIEGITGKAIQCACSFHFPNLSTIVTPDSKDSQQGPLVVPLNTIDNSDMVDLTTALTQNWQLILQYSDAFAPLVESVCNELVGDETSQFPKLTDPQQVSALSGFFGQLSGMWRNLYVSTFLTELQTQQGEEALSKLETSINSAISAEKQQLLVNPTGYIG